MIVGTAHVGVCVPDVEAAVAWYRDVLGFRVLSPPYRMAGRDIERDMGELVPAPVVVKAAIVGTDRTDSVIELIEYPAVPTPEAPTTGAPTPEAPDPEAPMPAAGHALTTPGLTHLGLLCDDVVATRAELEGRGVEFLTAGVADVAGLRTTWFHDPWGVVFILVEKTHAGRPYWAQHRD